MLGCVYVHAGMFHIGCFACMFHNVLFHNAQFLADSNVSLPVPVANPCPSGKVTPDTTPTPLHPHPVPRRHRTGRTFTRKVANDPASNTYRVIDTHAQFKCLHVTELVVAKFATQNLDIETDLNRTKNTKRNEKETKKR